jgi:hypothetical protein
VSIIQPDLIIAGKAIAQDAGADSATGVKLLLNTTDYDQAVDQALAIFSKDRPNRRVKDYTVVTAGFRFNLSGGSSILPTSGLDAWVEGGSAMHQVWWPYVTTNQTLEALDENDWRLTDQPNSITAIEFLQNRPKVGDVIRLVYAVPHSLDASTAASSSPKPGDLKALKVLTASLILVLAANKLMQNTGNTGLPNDVVDRRTQADVARSLAKDLRALYGSLVGQGSSDQVGPASGFLDLDVEPIHGYGSLWHPSRLR